MHVCGNALCTEKKNKFTTSRNLRMHVFLLSDCLFPQFMSVDELIGNSGKNEITHKENTTTSATSNRTCSQFGNTRLTLACVCLPPPMTKAPYKMNEAVCGEQIMLVVPRFTHYYTNRLQEAASQCSHIVGLPATSCTGSAFSIVATYASVADVLARVAAASQSEPKICFRSAS